MPGGTADPDPFKDPIGYHLDLIDRIAQLAVAGDLEEIFRLLAEQQTTTEKLRDLRGALG
jgi:hypothetical protein